MGREGDHKLQIGLGAEEQVWRLALETAIGPVFPLLEGKDREARWDMAAATGGVRRARPAASPNGKGQPPWWRSPTPSRPTGRRPVGGALPPACDLNLGNWDSIGPGVCGSRMTCLGPGRKGMEITSGRRDARSLTFSIVIPARVMQPKI